MKGEKKGLSFEATGRERELIEQAAQRAVGLGIDRSSIDIEMDLAATHANGCRLDFEKLLGFDDFSFCHDIIGIARNLNHETGELENCFLPRCARRT
jgi:hypothetical protein